MTLTTRIYKEKADMLRVAHLLFIRHLSKQFYLAPHRMETVRFILSLLLLRTKLHSLMKQSGLVSDTISDLLRSPFGILEWMELPQFCFDTKPKPFSQLISQNI